MPSDHWLSLLFCVVASFAFWLIFYPTVFSRDSFYMLLDATRGQYSDMHPILIPIVLSGLLKVGLGVAAVTLAQMLLGLMGIRHLVIALERLWGADGIRESSWRELLILALLVSPLTPLAIYLATIWSDTWLAILLIWIMALLLDLRQEVSVARPPRTKVAAVVILLGLLLLVRYNAVVMYPFLLLPFVGTLRRYSIGWVKALVLAALPMIMAVTFLGVQYRLNRIEHFYPERAVYALDLASMVLYDPSICRNLSLQSCDLILGEFSPGFRVGDGAIDLTLTEANEFPYAPFLELVYYPGLDDDFRMAAVQHPGLLMTVDVLNFLDYVGPNLHQYFFQNRTIPGDLLQLPRQTFASPDNRWFLVARQVHWSPVLSWFSYVHAVWLLVGISLLAGFCLWGLRHPRSGATFVSQLLLAPMAYYFGYLLALTTSEFRFMYPSTLAVQVVTLTLLTTAVSRRWHGRQSAQTL